MNDLGVVKAILPVLLGKEDGNGARPDSFFADGSNGGGRPFPGRAHQPTAEKEFHYLRAWEEKMALQAEGESGIGEAELVALSAQLGRPMSEAQARDALLAMEMGPTVDSATFLHWWRNGGVAGWSSVRSVAESVESILSFQGIGCHTLCSSDGSVLGGEALAEEVASRVAQCVAELGKDA